MLMRMLLLLVLMLLLVLLLVVLLLVLPGFRIVRIIEGMLIAREGLNAGKRVRRGKC